MTSGELGTGTAFDFEGAVSRVQDLLQDWASTANNMFVMCEGEDDILASAAAYMWRIEEVNAALEGRPVDVENLR